MNELENFSHFIYSGVTDEEFCFSLEGDHILSYIIDAKHYLAFFRGSEDDTVYSGVVKLYNDWQSKTSHQALLKQKKALEYQLELTPSPRSVKVIGR